MSHPIVKVVLTGVWATGSLVVLGYIALAHPDRIGWALVVVFGMGFTGGAYAAAVRRGLPRVQQVLAAAAGTGLAVASLWLLTELEGWVLRVTLVVLLAIAILGRQDYGTGLLQAALADHRRWRAKRASSSNPPPSPP